MTKKKVTADNKFTKSTPKKSTPKPVDKHNVRLEELMAKLGHCDVVRIPPSWAKEKALSIKRQAGVSLLTTGGADPQYFAVLTNNCEVVK